MKNHAGDLPARRNVQRQQAKRTFVEAATRCARLCELPPPPRRIHDLPMGRNAICTRIHVGHKFIKFGHNDYSTEDLRVTIRRLQ